MVRKFLKAGVVEDGKQLSMELEGMPQGDLCKALYKGSIISPTLALIVLSGFEKTIKSLFLSLKIKYMLITYCDDFIISTKLPELIQEKIIPAIREFLGNVGLELSC